MKEVDTTNSLEVWQYWDNVNLAIDQTPKLLQSEKARFQMKG